MADDPRTTMAAALAARERAATPEQLAERKRVDARNRALQELGMAGLLPQPPSGIWGGQKKGKP